MTVNEAHLEQTKQRIRSMSVEEHRVIVQEIPLPILATELWNRMSELCKFKAEFDALVEKSDHLEKFSL